MGVPADQWTAVEIERPEGRAPLVLVCEHASRHIPPELGDLGLGAKALSSHIAWDIGALDLARGLSQRLDAPLVAGGVSRLVYDLNRPLESAGAIPDRSETFDIPGNRALTARTRRDRHDRLHGPFHAALAQALSDQEARCGGPVDLITIHSFTPVYAGIPRAVEIGFLFHEDARLAQAALAAETAKRRYRAALNDPYGPEDGVTHTLVKHGDGAGRRALMIEVANTLIADVASAEAMATHLADTLTTTLARVSA